MKGKLVTILGLLLFCLIVLMPPVVHGYMYPNIGDDAAAHMNILDEIEVGGQFPEVRYGAYYIVGYPLDIISRAFDVDKDTLFLWFNYLALLAVGISLFFVFKKLVGLSCGLLALILPTFTSYAILLLFYSGVIFNIINIGIILPFTVFCVIRCLITKKRRYFIGASCLAALFAVFHSTGIYLPFMVAIGVVSFVVYKWGNREIISKKHIVFMATVSLCGVALCVLFNPILDSLFVEIAKPDRGVSGIPLLQESLLHYMSPFVLAILAGTIVWLWGKYKQVLPTERLAIYILGIAAIIMLPAMLFGWSPQPFRQGYDFAILLSLVSVVLVGVVIRLDKRRVVSVLLVCLAVGGAVVNVGNWVGGYNSALEKIDVEAIDYVNTLPGVSYSCTENVDHWIYSRYVTKQYLSTDGVIFITRNVPMKSRVGLIKDDVETFERVFLNKFTNGVVEIVVYK